MIEPNDFEPRRIELDRNLGTDLDQSQDRTMGDDCQNPITEDMDELEKLVSRCPTSSHGYTPFFDSAKSIADSGLEDRELRKILTSPLFLQRRSRIFSKTLLPFFLPLFSPFVFSFLWTMSCICAPEAPEAAPETFNDGAQHRSNQYFSVFFCSARKIGQQRRKI